MYSSISADHYHLNHLNHHSLSSCSSSSFKFIKLIQILGLFILLLLIFLITVDAQQNQFLEQDTKFASLSEITTTTTTVPLPVTATSIITTSKSIINPTIKWNTTKTLDQSKIEIDGKSTSTINEQSIPSNSSVNTNGNSNKKNEFTNDSNDDDLEEDDVKDGEEEEAINNNQGQSINSMETNQILSTVLKLNASSSFVANCTDVEFYCEIIQSPFLSTRTEFPPSNSSFSSTSPLSAALIAPPTTAIWWTFRGQNVSSSTLPGGRVIIRNNVDNPAGLSVLNVECAQFGIHDGDYNCHTSLTSQITGSHIVANSTNLHFEISVLLLDPIDQSNRTIRQEIDTEVALRCHVYGYPKPHIVWQRYDPNTLITIDVEPDGRIDIEDKFLPDPHDLTLVENSINPLKSFQSILRFESLKRSDNGTYKCRATGSQKSEKPKTQDFQVIVLEVPEIHIEKIEIENKTSAVVSFVVDYDGNLPIEKYILELRNYTEENSTWSLVASPLIVTQQHNYSQIEIIDLVHAANYGFRLAATNAIAGQSEWSQMNITVPADVPSTINNVHLLSKSNETLLFGWRRPLHDNGAAIIQFHQILKDDQDRLIWNQTMNNTQSRNKHMSLFSNLYPGSHYSFQIRACSDIGCGDWSAPFEAVTSDGHSEPPRNIHLQCLFDSKLAQTNATINWEAPSDPRGSILGYNISLRGHSAYSSNRHFESFEQSYKVNGNETFQYNVVLRPNSNHTVRICAINKSGCGQFSPLTSSSMCQSSPTVPGEFPPGIRLERVRGPTSVMTMKEVYQPFVQQQDQQQQQSRQLKLFVPRISERNGPFRCIRVIVLRLPSNPPFNDNSTNATDQRDSMYQQYLDDSLTSNSIPLSTYKMVHKHEALGAYIAKEFTADNFPPEIIIGDGRVQRCFDDALEYDLKSRVNKKFRKTNLNALDTGDEIRSPRRIKYDLNVKNNSVEDITDDIDIGNLVEDSELLPDTYYSAAIEVTVMAVNHTLLTAQSPWVEPVRTEPLQLIQPQSSHRFTETTTGILYGTFFGLSLILILFSTVLCFIKRKVSEQSTPVLLDDDERIGLTSFIRRTITGTRNRKNSSSLFYQLNFNSTQAIRKWASKPIPLQTLVAVFQQRRTNSDFLFQAEFESLPESFPDRTTLASEMAENGQKNRYPDIKSYDQTRVVLEKIDDIVGSDYINADFVIGYKPEKQFICAQGPTQRTIPDFWRLVFEKKCCIIVMLTGIEEQGRIKCAQYWNDDQPIKFSYDEELTGIKNGPEFEIETVYHREYSDYVVRRFKLTKTGLDDFRNILHFHFVAWRDFLAPDQPSWLLRFIKRVNEHYCVDRGPIVVHCSAGVGRTGTFIAIDSLISQIDDGAQEINVFTLVSQLRHQRNYLVQSLRQYIFVYRAIMEYVEFGDTEIESLHLRDHYRQLKEQKTDSGNGIVSEFEKLNEVFEEVKSCIVGSLDANKSKNRYSFIIPYDINRVILNPSQDSYINASFIQGYDHTLSFIVAQDPMEHTVNEFWLMIVEHNVTTLVMLAELSDFNNTNQINQLSNKCHCYWPSRVDETFDCDYVKVKLIEEEMTFQYFIKRVFHVTKKKTNKSHVVNQYQFLSWKSGVVVPESTISLITLIDIVLIANDNDNNNNFEQIHIDSNLNQSNKATNVQLTASPILVHCSGGGDRSSVFVAFASLVKQLQLEERIDIFQTARYTKSQRHCMLQTIAQYDFLYRCLIDYMDHHHICNMSSDTQL